MVGQPEGEIPSGLPTGRDRAKRASRHPCTLTLTAVRAAEKLDYYIETRGAIAHRGSYDSSVRKGWVTDYYNHVCRLVERTESRVAEVLTDATAVPPWD
jgi:hypothetical protein